MSHRAALLLTVDTEASMAGLRPLPPDVMVYGQARGGAWGIERIMACCEARGFQATFFVSTLEALHYGQDHVRRMCATALERGHDVQLHVHPVWLGGRYAGKALTSYDLAGQREAIEEGIEQFRAATGSDPLVHRAGGLWANADTLQALHRLGIGYDASVAVGYHDYDFGPANVPRRVGEVVEVPVTTFAQMRLGGWSLMRTFDINADSLSELCFVVDRAVAEGVAAVTLLMHSFSLVARNRDSTRFWPAEGELRKFERFLDWVAGRGDVEVVTCRGLADRLEAEPRLLDGPGFAPTSGVLRTYERSWQRFGTGWKSKAFALGLPAAALGLAALVIASLWWLTS